MSRIPYTRRHAGRYMFRRRVHFRNVISKPIMLALGTADPGLARERAAVLSVRFGAVRAKVGNMLETGRPLNGAEIEALFRAELERELRFYVQSAYEDAPWSSSVPDVASQEMEAYRLLRRPDRRFGMTDDDREDLRARGREHEIPDIAEYVEQVRALLTDDVVEARLRAIGAPVTESNVSAARTHLIRAGAVACERATRVFDEHAQSAPDPIQALIADLGNPSAEAAALLGRSRPAPEASPFLINDRRPFSDIIETVLSELKRDGTWKGDLAQQRRIAQSFAWITGNKALGDYTHLDVDRFKRGLQKLPTTFRFGTLQKGAMSRPFDDVVAELGSRGDRAERRTNATINRDLSTMSTIARHLAATVWAPRIPEHTVLNFAKAMLSKDRSGDDPRPPWTRAHMACLFSSPIWTGGGGPRHRLKASSHPQVWHDAAYFAPLIWYYHGACREEICGLRVDEVDIDHDVPHFVIQDNDVRGRDGELAGEKREARRRTLPLHPELLRLGFADYVRAIRAEGKAALFPELYQFDAKRGGAFFYDRAWRFMVDWIGAHMEIPRNRAGKRPDIHSIRALSSSFYEVDGVNEIVRADVMGHARTGTNAKHYSKRETTEGLTTILRERLAFLCRYVPVITAELEARPIQLLSIHHRSRVGSGRARKMRADAGVKRPD